MSASENPKARGLALAAGGLVWKSADDRKLIAVVHRARHGDWTLPKGKPEPAENLDRAALREVQEETGLTVTMSEFAGSYSYLADGTPKVVVMWHFRATEDPFPAPAPVSEIDQVAWLAPAVALERLSHPAERGFLAHALGETAPRVPTVNPGSAPDEKLDRLAAALHTVRERLEAAVTRNPASEGAWWSASARRCLQAAHTAWLAKQLDTGWGALHDAERFLVCGLTDTELVAYAERILVETSSKARGWRGEGAGRLFGALPLAEWRRANVLPQDSRPKLEAVVMEALSLLHGHSDNVYHHMRLVERQLKWMIVWCLGLLAAVLVASNLVGTDSLFTFGNLFPVLLAGAFGGVLSALFQLSRVGQQKIPEALLHGLITSGRPIIGMISALFVYLMLRSGLINLPKDSPHLTEALTLGFAFAAGFTDRLVLSSVGRLTGGGEGSTRPSKPGGES